MFVMVHSHGIRNSSSRKLCQVPLVPEIIETVPDLDILPEFQVIPLSSVQQPRVECERFPETARISDAS